MFGEDRFIVNNDIVTYGPHIMILTCKICNGTLDRHVRFVCHPKEVRRLIERGESFETVLGDADLANLSSVDAYLPNPPVKMHICA